MAIDEGRVTEEMWFQEINIGENGLGTLKIRVSLRPDFRGLPKANFKGKSFELEGVVQLVGRPFSKRNHSPCTASP